MTLLGKHAAPIAVVGGLFLKEGEISYLCNHDKYPRYPHSQFPSMDIVDNDNHVVKQVHIEDSFDSPILPAQLKAQNQSYI